MPQSTLLWIRRIEPYANKRDSAILSSHERIAANVGLLKRTCRRSAAAEPSRSDMGSELFIAT
jgi:hypothetical protein